MHQTVEPSSEFTIHVKLYGDYHEEGAIAYIQSEEFSAINHSGKSLEECLVDLARTYRNCCIYGSNITRMRLMEGLKKTDHDEV